MQTRLTPEDPVVFENPAYADLAAAGGGVARNPEKSGLPYDPSLYQPGYQAGPLPPKDYMPDGETPMDPRMASMAAGYPEPPPAYSPNNPQEKDPNTPSQ